MAEDYDGVHGGEQVQIQVIGLNDARRHLQHSADALALAPREVIAEAATILRDALRHAAPESKTPKPGGGHMRDTIDFDLLPGVSGETAVFKASQVARWVIGGTAPHDIWAGAYSGKGSANVLHFFAGSGEEVFTPYVRHPGTKPNDFRKKAWSEARPAVMAMLRQTGMAVLRGEVLREIGMGVL
jgi:hypothetical protein